MTIEPTQRLTVSQETAVPTSGQTSRPNAVITKKPEPGVQFEAFFLQSFIQSILPQDATEVFGEGTAGEVWKSMLAEKVAMQFAEAGGIGIAKMISPKGNVPAADVPRTGLTAGKLLDMQLGATQAAATGAAAVVADEVKSR